MKSVSYMFEISNKDKIKEYLKKHKGKLKITGGALAAAIALGPVDELIALGLIAPHINIDN